MARYLNKTFSQFMFKDKILVCADIVYPYSDIDGNCWHYQPEKNSW